jgi:hypothetical protein
MYDLLKNDLFPHPYPNPNPTLTVAYTNFCFILVMSRQESNENVPIFSAGVIPFQYAEYYEINLC